MTRSRTRSHWRAAALALVVSVGFGVVIGLRLAGYGVPVLLALSCGLLAAAGVHSLLHSIADGLSTTTHRCTVPSCGWRVRVRHVDAAENRRWQEAAAAHPAHEQR